VYERDEHSLYSTSGAICESVDGDVRGSPNRREGRGVSSRVRRRDRNTGEAVAQDHSPPEIAGELGQFCGSGWSRLVRKSRREGLAMVGFHYSQPGTLHQHGIHDNPFRDFTTIPGPVYKI
jgi:hypothetical protein